MNLLSIDWISCTRKKQTHRPTYTAHPSLHDWENWAECSALHGYTSGGKHTTGVRVFHSDKRVDMGYHIQYSGSALRRVEEYNGTTAMDVLDHHVDEKHHFSRLDIALDMINTGVVVDYFENAFLQQKAITRIKTAAKTQSLTHEGHTFYIGSQKRKKKLVRVYDKAAEQGLKGDWVRVETQIMGIPATVAAKTIHDSQSKQTAMAGVMKDICDFPTIVQWSEVMENIQAVEIGSISSEKGDTRKWLIEQCVPALAKELTLDSSFWGEFCDALKNHMPMDQKAVS